MWFRGEIHRTTSACRCGVSPAYGLNRLAESESGWEQLKGRWKRGKMIM